MSSKISKKYRKMNPFDCLIFVLQWQQMAVVVLKSATIHKKKTASDGVRSGFGG
jgi:hypothetical protein